jgi:predicted negative regulator of RcsB-dependent stress response
MQMLRRYETKKAEQASILYQEILTAVQNVDITVAKTKGELLLKEYSKTPYAALGAMILAKVSSSGLTSAIFFS